MKYNKGFIALVVALIAVVVLVTVGYVLQTKEVNVSDLIDVSSCKKLSRDFDTKIDTDNGECDKWDIDKKPIWVGGKLVSISQMSKASENPYGRNEFSLTFKGDQKQGNIYINTKNEIIPYEVNKFYKFDLGNKCKLRRSMASSGGFSDPTLDALEELKKCN